MRAFLPRRRGLALTLGVLLAAFLGGAAAQTLFLDYSEATAGPEPVEVPQARLLSDSFQQVAEMVTPSVVGIQAAARTRAPGNPFEHHPFRDFFGDRFFERFVPRDDGDRIRQGQGSGFVIDEDGIILTNHHVVRDAEHITVTLADDREFEAELVGEDPHTDLAVLRIDADGLPALGFGDSDALEIGEWVVAVGNPFGLQSSITSGIVSAKGRANVGITDYEDFIQTDAAINPGNSGGPLVNLDGEVVGVNTAIMTRSGGYMGVGFAIPANMARDITDRLVDDGRVTRGWLGVQIQRLTPDLAASFGYEGDSGVLVSDVVQDSPADEAGLATGDILVEFDGRPVEGFERFRARVAATEPGSKVDVMVFRDGDTKELEVRLRELETRVATRTEDLPGDLGLTVRTLTTDLAARLELPRDTKGVVVTEVEPLGPAHQAGLRRNDVITEVQGEAVEDIAGFREQIESADRGRGIRLTVTGRNGQRFVVLRTRAS